MIFNKTIFLFILANAAFQSFSQSKALPAEAKSFVLKGYEMMDYVTGDLNGDKRADAILILKVKGEDTVNDDANRPFIILIRQPNGKLKSERRNDSAIMCYHCGGVFGDPYESTSIENNGFTLNFYGGSNDRWGYTYFFSYDAKTKNWALIKEKDVSYRSTDPENTTQETTIGAAELEGISIRNFNSSPAYNDDKWKVSAAKTFFYNDPRIGSKPRKGYLMKNDVVAGIRELKNFVEVSFENGNEQFTTGYALKKDLVKIK